MDVKIEFYVKIEVEYGFSQGLVNFLKNRKFCTPFRQILQGQTRCKFHELKGGAYEICHFPKKIENFRFFQIGALEFSEVRGIERRLGKVMFAAISEKS